MLALHIVRCGTAGFARALNRQDLAEVVPDIDALAGVLIGNGREQAF